MRTARVLTLLVVAALIPGLSTASSSGRPIDDPSGDPYACYQLNPYVPGQPRGQHRILCGYDAPVFTPTRPAVSTLHARASRTVRAPEILALSLALAGLTLSTAAALAGRRHRHRRPRVLA